MTSTHQRDVYVSAVIQRGERFLLVQEAKADVRGEWNLPGGRLEPGEQPIDGAIREVREETGLCATVDALMGVHVGPNWVRFIYLGRVPDDATARAGDEILDVAWRTNAEISADSVMTSYSLPASLRRACDDADRAEWHDTAVDRADRRGARRHRREHRRETVGSDRRFGDAQDFRHGGQSVRDLAEPVLTQGDHAAFTALTPELGHVRVARHGVTHEVVEHEQLVETVSTAVAGLDDTCCTPCPR